LRKLGTKAYREARFLLGECQLHGFCAGIERTGNPYVVVGGNQGNLAELTAAGFSPLLTAGDRVDPGVDYFGAPTGKCAAVSEW